MLHRICQGNVVDINLWVAAVVVGNQQQILAETGTVSIQVRCADMNSVVAVLNGFYVAVRELYLPLILIDAALPGSAIKSELNRGTGGEMGGGTGEDNAVFSFLVTDRIVTGDRIQGQRR